MPPEPPCCPACRAPMPHGRLEGVCPACFFKEMGGGAPDTGSWLPGITAMQEIARGGMGIVYRAEQVEPPRPVAVKILQPQFAGDADLRERFQREARAMALLEHPAILPVFEVGETDDLPWFTMKLMTGGSLAEHLADFRGQWRRIAELVAVLADALDFAHQRGVLHRDVKPGNVLFDAAGRPFLSDFGVAKRLTDDAGPALLQTSPLLLLGTPLYLAPELAAGTAAAATTAADIYSLGAVLYELLAGRPPFAPAGLPQLLLRIAHTPPPSLQHTELKPPPDLEHIARKAMEKEPAARYPTAREFAEDLRCFLEGRTTKARPAGWTGRLRRWCRRHPAIATLAAALVLLMAFAAAGAVVSIRKIRRAEAKAVADRRLAEQHTRESLLAQAEATRMARLPGFRRLALELSAAAASPEESADFRVQRRTETIAALAFPEMVRAPLPVAPAPGMRLTAVSPGLRFTGWTDGETWRVAGRDGTAVSTGKSSAAPAHLSADGRMMTLRHEGGGWELWDTTAAEGTKRGEFPGEVEDLSADGAKVAFYHPAAEDSMAGETLETGSLRRLFRLEFPNVGLKMRFSPDGRLCAVAPSSYLNTSLFPYSVRLHRTEDGTMERELAASLSNCVWCMAWSPDGTLLSAGERGGAAFVWNTADGSTRQVLRGAGAGHWQAAFSPDGNCLASIGDDRLLTILDLRSGEIIARGGAAWIIGKMPLTWIQDQPDTFGPLTIDGGITMVRLKPGVFSVQRAPGSFGKILGLAISPDGRRIVTGDSRHARLWDGGTGALLQVLASGLWSSFAFTRDGQWLYGAGEEGAARWKAGHSIDPASRVNLLPPGSWPAVSLSGNGELLAAASDADSGTALIRLPASEQPGHFSLGTGGTTAVAVTPDGTRLAAGGYAGLAIFATDSLRPVHEEPGYYTTASFNFRGDQLLLGGAGYEIRAAGTWECLQRLPVKPLDGLSARAAFSQDGRWLATVHPYGRIALWSGGWPWTLTAVLENPGAQPLGRICFAPDSARLYAAASEGLLQRWDLDRIAAELAARGLGW